MAGIREMRDTTRRGQAVRSAFDRRLREEGTKHRNLGVSLGLLIAITVALVVYMLVR